MSTWYEIRRMGERHTDEGLIITNKQLEQILVWCEEKQKEENNRIDGEIILSDKDYFRQFFIDFNLPDSVGLKTQSEIIEQNQKYNELYIKYRNLISVIKHLQKELREEGIIYTKKYLSDVISEYDVIDPVNEELIERGVNIWKNIMKF